MIRISSVAVIIVALAAVLLYAQEKQTTKITGFLIDNMCATGKDDKDKEHPVSCALMPKCEASGYAVVSNDTVYKLDDQGNKLAVKIIKATKTKKGLAVNVEGTVVNGTLQVDSMAEVE